ncbi:MAG: NADPH-dependent assimilatory sulfite reductase hemoprotein subunit [Verrucomicrobia bacterium]|nr:NADPH-dependent assimilatory sulfite reductase hemoprotein subunit [Verrucomicrobiota bacterium]
MSASTESKLTHNEVIKDAIPTLAGNIAATLQDAALDRFSEDDTQFLKFHGIYQQDDRDKRKTAKQFMFMIRGRIPGGVLSGKQYLVFDDLATRYGNQTLRITSRQSFQFHGVVKAGLGKLMRGINDALVDTLAACGDVNRNVMSPPTPATSAFGTEVLEDARRVSTALLPKTKAYHSIWVEGVQLNLEDPSNKDFEDPLYGKTYLPRKFKTAFAIPPLNDTDVLTNCLGFIAIEENGKLTGYNLTAGGGLGMSHGNAETYPRVGDVIGFVTPGQLIEASRAVLMVHRDFGDRTNRKHARLKYVLEEKGVEWFRAELAKRLGWSLAAAKPFRFERQGDVFGWHRQQDGRMFLGLYVETGRIKDQGSCRLMSALREIVGRFSPEIRLTPSQNLVLSGIQPSDQSAIDAILKSHGIDTVSQGTILGRASMACPALPTCGLALAESERYLPGLLARIEALLAELHLGNQEIIVRMTGCPNGCARPYMAEIGFVGKAPGKYNVYLGGNEASTRLNRVFRESVKETEIVNELRPVLTRFSQERQTGERFGDWCDRVFWKDTVSQPGGVSKA